MSDSTPKPAQALGVWDMASLIVGIVVGTAIFRAPPDVFAQFQSPWSGLAMWLAGGLLAFTGALCYSELATAYTDFGAEYAFLTRAYGRQCGFLFAWMQLCVILTGSIGAMSFVFVDYLNKIAPLPTWSHALVAISAVLVLLMLQIAGLRTGKFVQNLLSGCKILALIGLLATGLFATGASKPNVTATEFAAGGSLSYALILVMFAYAGWNDATSVAPEVREGQRNIPRALLYGLGGITLLYVAVNWSYWRVLGFEGVRRSKAPAADLVALRLGTQYAWAMSVVIMISALGAIHGTMFAGSRLLAALGRDYPALGIWRKWNARGAPVWALVTIAAISTVLTLMAGTSWGLSLLQLLARPLGVSEEFDPDKGFELLVSTASPVFFFFFMLTGLGLIVLRLRDPLTPRPFRVPGYPFTPLVLCTIAGFMCYSGLIYMKMLMLLSVPPLLAGVILAFTLTPRIDDTQSEPGGING